MSAQFHPGVTNCGGTMAGSGCSCARTVTGEATDIDLMAAAVEAKPLTSREKDEQAIREWMATASDEHFVRLCTQTSTWVDDVAHHPGKEVSSEPDWYAIKNSYVGGCLGRTPHRELPGILLDEIRTRQATDISPGADERVKAYEKAARTFFTHTPEHLGSPTTANEACGLWQGAQRGSDQNGRGFFIPRFVDAGQPGDPLADPEAVRFAVDDTECAGIAIETLRRGFHAGNGSTRQFVLQMAASPNRDVRAQVAKVVNWDDDLVEVFAQDPEPVVRANLAGQMANLVSLGRDSKATLTRVARSSDRRVNEWHRNGRRLEDTSQRLARDPDTDVRRALATSQHFADEKTQRILAKDPDPMVRHVLAANAWKSQLDEKAIKTLARDPEPGVREALAKSGAPIPKRSRKHLGLDSPAPVPTLQVKDGRIQRTA